MVCLGGACVVPSICSLAAHFECNLVLLLQRWASSPERCAKTVVLQVITRSIRIVEASIPVSFRFLCSGTPSATRDPEELRIPR